MRDIKKVKHERVGLKYEGKNRENHGLQPLLLENYLFFVCLTEMDSFEEINTENNG